MKSEAGRLMPGEAMWQHPCLQQGAGDHKMGLKANPRACTPGRGEGDAELVQ